MVQLQKEMLKDSKVQQYLNKQRVKEITKAELELRQEFIDCNSFIKDCEQKKKIALSKIEEEKKIQTQLENKISKIEESIKELQDFKVIIKNTVESLEPYEKVIKEVVEKSDIMSSVKDCMLRCDALSKFEIFFQISIF